MSSTSDLKPLQDRVTTSLVDVTRKAGQISTEDLSFHRSSNSSLSRSLDVQNARLLQLTQKLLQAASCTESNVALPRLRDGEDLDDQWLGLVDVVDDLLEHADACLDEYTGIIKRMSPAAKDAVAAASEPKVSNFPSIPTNRRLLKPQLSFEKLPANHDLSPFKPLLQSKPHSAVDLKESIGNAGKDGFKHPYTPEIERFAYPDMAHSLSDPIPYLDLDRSEVTFIDTKQGLDEMLAELRNASEIAIDLEHHHEHSYVGIVCLMQISTRQKDWIIDTLVSWREDLQILNEVFADPKILKVLQGSSMDIIWLQRDFGLYIVGLFDTFHASNALGFPQKSLKYLLQRFCGVHANKKLQLADWRIRPVPQEMLDYARSDTHYLLFIYDNIRNMLLQASAPENQLVTYVLEESKKEALQRYERPMYDADRGLGPVGWFGPLARRSVRFTPEQFSVYRAVHEWRDKMARDLDEGVATIMTPAKLFAVAEAMPATVYALLNITSYGSQAIKDSSSDLVKIIHNAKATGKDGPTMADVMLKNSGFLPRQRSIQKPTEARQDHGIAATFQRLNENGEVDSNVERASVSQFWGNVSKSLVPSASRDLAPLYDALRLVLPLPATETMSFTAAAEATPVEEFNERPTELSPPKQAGESAGSSDIFVLKRLGSSSGKRNKVQSLGREQDIADATNGVHTNEQSPFQNNTGKPATDPVDAQGGQRGLKRQMEASGMLSDETNGHFQPEPFDYANAESVLHTKPGHNRPHEQAAGQQRFNLAAKALDAPGGVKRARKEAGRSFTFKK